MLFSSDKSDDSNSEVSDDDDLSDDDDNDNGDGDNHQTGNYEDVGKSKRVQYQEESGDERTLQSHDQGQGACGLLNEDELLGRSVDDENLLSYEKNSKLSTEKGLPEITERTELVNLDDR